jgi:hypothetical protein
MQFSGRGVVALVAATLALAGLSGCSAETDDAVVSPYAAEFDAARASTDDPTLLKILEDDKISDEEFQEMTQMQLDCIEEKLPGVDAEYQEQGASGGISIMDKTGRHSPEQNDEVARECAALIPQAVGVLYSELRENPDKADWSDVLLACLKRFGVVDDSMTVDELKAVDPNSPPWDPLSGDAYGCENQFAAYAGGQPDLTEPQQWPEGSHF